VYQRNDVRYYCIHYVPASAKYRYALLLSSHTPLGVLRVAEVANPPSPEKEFAPVPAE
jgi:hypothetical protein